MSKLYSLQNLFFLLVFAMVGVVGSALPLEASAQTDERFFVEKAYDADGRSSIDSFELLTGTYARIFVEEEYWDDLSSSKQEALRQRLTTLLATFDSTIYPRVTGAYGEPWTPGIDNDTKVTLLFAEMESGVGGYFRFDDQKPSVEDERSNEREMLYINVLYASEYRVQEFLAHELVHLIHYNQKTRMNGERENTWMSELLAEMGPRIAGLHETTYSGTNFQDRVEVFLKDPNNPLIEWEGENEDYSAVAMFGHYLYTQYGVAPLREAMRSPLKGMDALQDGLSKAGTGLTVQKVFADWVVTNVINDCAVGAGQYCYNDSQLGYNRLHIRFQDSGQKVENGADFSIPLESWSAQWLRAEYDEEGKADRVLVYELTSDTRGTVHIPYIVYEEDGDIVVSEFTLRGGSALVAVEGFGEDIEAVVFAPINTTSSSATFVSEVHTQNTVPAGAQVYEGVALVDTAGTPLVDGDLIRAVGTHDIYIAKYSGEKRFRRLILNPAIFESYGHLEWNKVKTVSSEVLAAFTDSQFVMEVYADGSPVNTQVYQIFSTPGADSGTKRAIVGGYDLDAVYRINHLEAADTFYPTTT